jgi:hypothetical protein
MKNGTTMKNGTNCYYRQHKQIVSESYNGTVRVAWGIFWFAMFLWWKSNFIVSTVAFVLAAFTGFIGIKDVRQRGGDNEDANFLSGLAVSALPMIIIFCRIAYMIVQVASEGFAR